MNKRTGRRITTALIFAALLSPHVLLAKPFESKRMERAKDLIADEQWARAVDELKAAAADPKEANKDEALFWLAHSQNQARDSAGSVETIRRLEREFPVSRWVKPARSLRIEIAQRLQRNDFLWYTAAPPLPSPAPAPPATTAPVQPVPAAAPPTPVVPVPTTPPAFRLRRPAPAPPVVATPAAPLVPTSAPFPPMPPPAWVPDGYFPDTDLRIQALGSLIRTDAVKVIPMLKEIALESGDTGETRRALFVLVQSGRSDARATVIDVAKTGPELVRLAAVRELGRLGGVTVANELLQVYSTANERVKYQVVTSLAQSDGAPALLRIVESEKNRRLRDVAIQTLGEAGGRQQLEMLYAKAALDAKRPIIIGLFNAQAEDELIRIAERERDPVAREEVLTRLRLLGTPRARAYLERHR
jgi:HEAT repeat protein